ncbi:hypothetical protein ACIRPK_33850 [Kitasatospora sp. NPDC101801]|uniref:hypothetical protein n=1 Tax=Kitasatospora sp. NPDC101801 TaxID=3364103 RepID=UPI003826D667
MRHDRYHQYAHLRLGASVLARPAVQCAFDRLEVIWPVILSSPSPDACAWDMLGESVAALARAAAPQAECLGLLDRLLPRAQADAVLLHHHLGMELKGAAELMGIEPLTVTAHLLTARRTIPYTLKEVALTHVDGW